MLKIEPNVEKASRALVILSIDSGYLLILKTNKLIIVSFFLKPAKIHFLF